MLTRNANPRLVKCVLIADDDSLVRGSLAAVLESEGFVVDEAQNGFEAVTRAIEHQPKRAIGTARPIGNAGQTRVAVDVE